MSKKQKRFVLTLGFIVLAFIQRHPAFVVVAPAAEVAVNVYWLWSEI